MSPQLTSFPALLTWKQQLAGILPLSELVECINAGMKNALFVSFWIVLCAIKSVFGYSTEYNVKDWLRQDCDVTCKHFQTAFSSRRALLSALISLNPDSKDESTKWIDLILVDTQDRRDRQAAMLLALGDISLVDQAEKNKY
ncbi:hypothetical protein BDR22DRAFT_978130 [Usnea florida]